MRGAGRAFCAGLDIKQRERDETAVPFGGGFGFQGYLADVYILDSCRGRGIGTALVDFAVEHGPSWRWLLHTRDAHGMYAKFGFGAPPETLMERDGTPATA